MSVKSQYRCAVYTRKSHEEGLDQDFNSLDAQAESCKAYIASQTSLGWNLRDQSYDDGGISGGHMERPGLQALIQDIKAGLIDIIVVYKVDRLTRSLTDFAKLVDVFDEHDVSFVSVTQAFNTTTSMGRLTLNVLLSFAQFEREVTAERIRDKIAASKAKGMWMGGTCPIGYRNVDRKLHIVKAEAETIRVIYDLYIELKNVRQVKAQADNLGLVSRQRIHKSGKQSGGKPFTRGHIYRMLTNPIYIGQIQHKEKIYAGNHEAIIDTALWDQVQAIIKDNAVKRTTIGNSKSPTLLAGLLFDGDGNKLAAHHVNKKGMRYHYYVSQKLKTGDQDSGWRIPAKTLERIVHQSLVSTLASKGQLLVLLGVKTPSADQMQKLTYHAGALCTSLTAQDQPTLKGIYNDLITAIHIHTDKLSITFNHQGLQRGLNTELANNNEPILTLPMTIKRRGHEMKMVIDDAEQRISNPDTALIKLVSRAHLLKTELDTGAITSIKDFAAKYRLDHGDAKNLVPLAYLAPCIVADILEGHQPEDLTAKRLKHMSSLPMIWAEQRTYLGFN
ncbi:MAG: recombinase family protein [Alphaproteobacteria bacterium]